MADHVNDVGAEDGAVHGGDGASARRPAAGEPSSDESLSRWSLARARRLAAQSGHQPGRRRGPGPQSRSGATQGTGPAAAEDRVDAVDPVAAAAGVDDLVLDAALPESSIAEVAPGPVRVEVEQRGGLSGAGADPRDPLPLDGAIDELVARRAWQTPTQMASVQGRWEEIAGVEVAEHVSVESFDTGTGDLVLRADSTAWATQVRYLADSLLQRIADVAGEGIVTHLVVRGPDAPSWRAGRLRSPDSRGPRDTYG